MTKTKKVMIDSMYYSQNYPKKLSKKITLTDHTKKFWIK